MPQFHVAFDLVKDPGAPLSWVNHVGLAHLDPARGVYHQGWQSPGSAAVRQEAAVQVPHSINKACWIAGRGEVSNEDSPVRMTLVGMRPAQQRPPQSMQRHQTCPRADFKFKSMGDTCQGILMITTIGGQSESLKSNVQTMSHCISKASKAWPGLMLTAFNSVVSPAND